MQVFSANYLGALKMVFFIEKNRENSAGAVKTVSRG
jgi:hypothetical protein